MITIDFTKSNKAIILMHVDYYTNLMSHAITKHNNIKRFTQLSYNHQFGIQEDSVPGIKL